MKKKLVFCYLILPFLAFTGAGHSRASDTDTTSIQYANGRITIKATNTPFSQIVRLLSAKANLDIFLVGPNLPSSVSLHIDDLPVDRALQRILRGYNHAVVYYPGGEEQDSSNAVDTTVSSRSAKILTSHMEIRQAGAPGLSKGPGQITGSNSRNSNFPRSPIGSNLAGTHDKGPGNISASHHAQTASMGPSFGTDEDAGDVGGTENSDGSASYLSATRSLDDAGGSVSYLGDENESGNFEDTDNGSYTSDHEPSDNSAAQAQHLQQMIDTLEEQIDSGYAQQWYEKWSQIKDPKYITHPEDRLAELYARLANLF